MPQRERVSPLREGMPQCGKLCPSVESVDFSHVASA